MVARTKAMTGAGLVGLALLVTACSSGGTATTATSAAGTPTTVASKTAVTSTADTTLAPACPGSGSPASSGAVQGGGTHTSYSFATTDYASIVTACDAALRAAGWTVASTGTGGSGRYGGGGSTVTKGTRYATFDVGSSGARAYLDVCVWPTRPADTNCGQNSGNDNQNTQNDDDNQN
jgi:hypothetical protein